MPDFFSPLTALLGTLLAGAHALATTIGLSGAADWVVAIALLTCAVRLVLLPLAISGAKHARAAAKAAPAMRELQAKYAGKRDQESIKAMMQERKAIQAEHGMSAAGCLPVLLQMPVFLSLYHLIMKVTDGKRVGALSNQAVGSAMAASLFGVGLDSRLNAVSGTQFVVILLIALVAGGATWATQRWFNFSTPAEGDPMAGVLKVMPWLSLVGVVFGAFFVPAGLVLYWMFSNLWTLGQQAVLVRKYGQDAPLTSPMIPDNA
ncbi:hypothetical protein GCM10027599_12440 [Yimella radicis]